MKRQKHPAQRACNGRLRRRPWAKRREGKTKKNLLALITREVVQKMLTKEWSNKEELKAQSERDSTKELFNFTKRKESVWNTILFLEGYADPPLEQIMHKEMTNPTPNREGKVSCPQTPNPMTVNAQVLRSFIFPMKNTYSLRRNPHAWAETRWESFPTKFLKQKKQILEGKMGFQNIFSGTICSPSPPRMS